MESTIYKNRRYSTWKGQKYLCCGSGNKTIYSRYLHRQIWFDNFGVIPKGYHVHHKDDNRFNNDINNLELLTGSDHCKMHMAKRVKENPEWFKNRMKEARVLADKWHGSPEGIKHHKQHAKKFNFGHFNYGKANCLFCKKEFEKKQPIAGCCSNNCKSSMRRNSGIDNIEAICRRCAAKFTKNKYSMRYNCTKCTYKHKKLSIETAHLHGAGN